MRERAWQKGSYMERGTKRFIVTTLKVEGLSRKKGIEINQLYVETGFHTVVLTETKEVEREVRKVGGFGTLLYGTKWSKNQMNKGMNGVRIYWKRELFEQEDIEVEEGVEGRQNDERVLIWKHRLSRIRIVGI